MSDSDKIVASSTPLSGPRGRHDHEEARAAARRVAGRILFYALVSVLAMFFALPMLWLVTAPFDAHPTYAVSAPSWTLDNFAEIGRNPYAVSSLIASVVLAVTTT
ncbi:MAG: hypothetical protein ACRDJ9_18675, partial [Dehalococcoidia bacterium]